MAGPRWARLYYYATDLRSVRPVVEKSRKKFFPASCKIPGSFDRLCREADSCPSFKALNRAQFRTTQPAPGSCRRLAFGGRAVTLTVAVNHPPVPEPKASYTNDLGSTDEAGHDPVHYLTAGRTLMEHSEYANHIRSVLPTAPSTLPAFVIDDQRRNNAARCMTSLVCHRLSQVGEPPNCIKHKTFQWHHGKFALRNSRIAGHHWSTAQETVVRKLHEWARQQPLVYLLTHWDAEAGLLHAWAVPEDAAFAAFAKLPTHLRGDSKTVRIGLDDHRLKNVPDAPSFAD